MKHSQILAVSAFFCLSCVGVEVVKDKFSCSQLDWFEIGRSDGVQGLNSMAYENKKTNCQDFTDRDHEKYVTGWYAGVDQFCSPQQGFAFGRTGRKYLNICPSAKEDDFLKAFRQGLKVYLYEKDNQKITDELQRISDSAEKSDGKKASSLVKRLTELETRLELNKALIAEIQKELDDSLSQSRTF